LLFLIIIIFFDNDFIINLLIYYKFKNLISTLKLIQQIKKYEFKSFNEESKFIISNLSIKKNLFAACNIGSIFTLKYFISFRINIIGINHFNLN